MATKARQKNQALRVWLIGSITEASTDSTPAIAGTTMKEKSREAATSTSMSEVPRGRRRCRLLRSKTFAKTLLARLEVIA